MGPINTGPDGCWYTALALAIIGLLVVLAGIGWLAWQLFRIAQVM
jgi:hypothetical protein